MVSLPCPRLPVTRTARSSESPEPDPKASAGPAPPTCPASWPPRSGPLPPSALGVCRSGRGTCPRTFALSCSRPHGFPTDPPPRLRARLLREAFPDYTPHSCPPSPLCGLGVQPPPERLMLPGRGSFAPRLTATLSAPSAARLAGGAAEQRRAAPNTPGDWVWGPPGRPTGISVTSLGSREQLPGPQRRQRQRHTHPPRAPSPLAPTMLPDTPCGLDSPAPLLLSKEGVSFRRLRRGGGGRAGTRK